MKWLRSFPLPGYFFLLSLFPYASYTQNIQHYCNERYDFCLDYPSDIFSESLPAENNDGLELRSADGDADLKVYGLHNVLGTTVEEEYNSFMKLMAETDKELHIGEKRITDKYFEVIFLVGSEIHYYKTTLLNNNFITIAIESNLKGLNKKEHTVDILSRQINFSIDS